MDFLRSWLERSLVYRSFGIFKSPWRQCLSKTNNVAAFSTTTHISIPYDASAIDLPATLPTITEIKSYKQIFNDKSAVKAVAVGPHFIVINGKSFILEEG